MAVFLQVCEIKKKNTKKKVRSFLRNGWCNLLQIWYVISPDMWSLLIYADICNNHAKLNSIAFVYWHPKILGGQRSVAYCRILSHSVSCNMLKKHSTSSAELAWESSARILSSYNFKNSDYTNETLDHSMSVLLEVQKECVFC